MGRLYLCQLIICQKKINLSEIHLCEFIPVAWILWVDFSRVGIKNEFWKMDGMILDDGLYGCGEKHVFG